MKEPKSKPVRWAGPGGPKWLAGADALRAVACLLVVASHLASRIDHATAPAAARPFVDWMSYGGYGVAIFFVLSGYLLSSPFWSALDAGKPMPSLRVYVIRRAARILPGYWLALTVTFVLSVTVLGLAMDDALVGRFLAGFALVSDWHWLTLFPVEFNGPLWSVAFEVTCYVLLPLGFVLLFRLAAPGLSPLGSRLLWAGVVGLALIGHVLITRYVVIDEAGRGWQYGMVGGAKAWTPFFNPIGLFAIFAIGALAAGVEALMPRVRSWLFDGAALIAAGGLAYVMARDVGSQYEGYGLLDLPYAFPWFPLAAAAFLLAAPRTRIVGAFADNLVLRYVARVSFGLYLWHFLVIDLMARFWAPAFDPAAENAWTVWLTSTAIALVISFAIATVSYYAIERPVVDWARGREAPRPRGAAVPRHSPG